MVRWIGLFVRIWFPAGTWLLYARGKMISGWAFDMRLSLSVFALLAVSACFCGCHDSVHTDKSIPAASADQPTTHILGPVFADEAGKIEHTFVVVNPSQKVVNLKEVSRTCTCTTAKIESQQLQPGESTRLQIEVDLTHRRGDFTGQVSVQNDLGEPWVYRLKTTVYERVECVPRSVHFGVRPTGAQGRQLFEVISVSSREPSLPKVLLPDAEDSNQFAVSHLSSTVAKLPDGLQRRRSHFALDFTARSATNLTELNLTVAADGHATVLPVNWRVEEPVLATPDRLFLRITDGQAEPYERRVQIHRRDGKAFVLGAVNCKLDGVQATVASNASLATHTIIINIDPSKFGKFVFGQICASTDDPSQPVVTIPLAASR